MGKLLGKPSTLLRSRNQPYLALASTDFPIEQINLILMMGMQ